MSEELSAGGIVLAQAALLEFVQGGNGGAAELFLTGDGEREEDAQPDPLRVAYPGEEMVRRGAITVYDRRARTEIGRISWNPPQLATLAPDNDRRKSMNPFQELLLPSDSLQPLRRSVWRTPPSIPTAA